MLKTIKKWFKGSETEEDKRYNNYLQGLDEIEKKIEAVFRDMMMNDWMQREITYIDDKNHEIVTVPAARVLSDLYREHGDLYQLVKDIRSGKKSVETLLNKKVNIRGEERTVANVIIQ